MSFREHVEKMFPTCIVWGYAEGQQEDDTVVSVRFFLKTVDPLDPDTGHIMWPTVHSSVLEELKKLFGAQEVQVRPYIMENDSDMDDSDPPLDEGYLSVKVIRPWRILS